MQQNCNESIGSVIAAIIYFAAAMKWFNGIKYSNTWSGADLPIVALLILLGYLGLVHLGQLVVLKWRRLIGRRQLK